VVLVTLQAANEAAEVDPDLISVSVLTAEDVRAFLASLAASTARGIRNLIIELKGADGYVVGLGVAVDGFNGPKLPFEGLGVEFEDLGVEVFH